MTDDLRDYLRVLVHLRSLVAYRLFCRRLRRQPYALASQLERGCEYIRNQYGT